MTKISDFKFGVLIAFAIAVLIYFIYVDTTILPTKTITFEAQELQCIQVKHTETDPDWICFGDKNLFWGMSYYAPLIAIYEDKHIPM